MFRSMRSIGVVLSLALLCVLCMGRSAFASSTAMIMVSGAEQQNFDQSWDVGPLQISFNGFTETIDYGQFSTPASIASSIAGQFTRDYAASGLCAHAAGTTVTFVLSGTQTFGILMTAGTTSSFALSDAGFATPAPPASSSGGGPMQVFTQTVNMTGGWDAGTFYDSGTVTVHVSGATAQVDWNEGSTTASVASELASAINTAAGGFVSANPNGATITVTSLNDGPSADMSITGVASDADATYFSSPSFAVSTQNMSGGTFSAGSPLYSFVIPSQGGYDSNGNLLTVSDSVMGQWSYAYDNLNRVLSATAPTSQPTGVSAYYAGVQTGWSYDAFGNRLSEAQGAVSGATPTAAMPTSSTNYYTAASNQLSSSTLASSITYDAAGDITYDGTNHYLYDAEGRICAVQNASNAITGYVYDASGIRVAKGSLSRFTCDFNSADTSTYNGYSTTTSWVLGPGGEQVTEYAVSGATQTWQHTNAFASGALLATYHDTDTYFALEDWLGTKRGEISAGGQIANYRSLAYGNGFAAIGSAPDATEHHFTGKERDTESGLDYFGARYYASSMGRWLSPDWSAKEDPVPYAKLDSPQTLNLYQYGLNNPLTVVDTDGHELKVAKELQDQVSTMRQQSPSFNAELSAYEGSNAPNLTIQFGATPNDPSGKPSIGNTDAPLSVDFVVSHDPKDDNFSYGPPKDTTITVNDSIKGDSNQVQDVLGHETGHAHDARTNSNQYGHDSQHTKETKGKTDHDSRPEEKRANGFKDTVNHEIKQYQKDHKHDK